MHASCQSLTTEPHHAAPPPVRALTTRTIPMILIADQAPAPGPALEAVAAAAITVTAVAMTGDID